MQKPLLFLLLFTNLTYAQNPLLYQYNWQLSYIVYNGVTYNAPSNPEVPNIFLQFTQSSNSFYTDVCNYLIGNSTASGTNMLAISNTIQSLILCNTQVNGDFEAQYFYILSQNGGGTLTYSFATSINAEPILTLTNSNNNIAVYNGIQLSTKNFKEDFISVYPNPSDDLINISSRNNSLENWNWEIYNQVGALLFSGKFNSNPSINVQLLTSGVYILKATDKNQQVVKKFIKK